MSPAPTELHVAHKLISSIQELPLWVKQVLYLELGHEISEHFIPDSMVNVKAEDTLAFYKPIVTPEGERYLLELKDDTGKLLMDCMQKLTILDICLHYQWSLEHICTLMIEAFRHNWLSEPDSIIAMGTIEYMANSIRLGEFLVKLGRISIEQLDQALRTQQYIKEALEEHTGLANILINLGFITRQDTEGILFLKDESRKPLEKLHIFKRLS